MLKLIWVLIFATLAFLVCFARPAKAVYQPSAYYQMVVDPAATPAIQQAARQAQEKRQNDEDQSDLRGLMYTIALIWACIIGAIVFILLGVPKDRTPPMQDTLNRKPRDGRW